MFRSFFSAKSDISDEPGVNDSGEMTPGDMHGAGEKHASRYGLVGGAWCAAKKPTEQSLGQKGTITIERDCGEDSFFISRNGDTTFAGVADGVGSWTLKGVDPKWFSWGLTNNWQAVASPDKPPKEVMQQGYERLLESKSVEHGSATAVIIKYDHDTAKLSTAVLSDSLYMIIRDGQVIFKSEAMQRSFNVPFQLHSAKEISSIPETDAATFEHDLQVGDIVIVGSDGLFDNSEDADILLTIDEAPFIHRHFPSQRIVTKNMKDVNMSRVAKMLGQQAKKYMTDVGKISPYIKAYNIINNSHYVGGKVDDVTVLAFMVTAPER
ncbi:phosphatase 2C-like domain-containing protein [Paraphysoderma sedebokerense]|nr:phosphatase 2C-like domain-containing protein [Paraphysoderma sedebokerense]